MAKKARATKDATYVRAIGAAIKRQQTTADLEALGQRIKADTERYEINEPTRKAVRLLYGQHAKKLGGSK